MLPEFQGCHAYVAALLLGSSAINLDGFTATDHDHGCHDRSPVAIATDDIHYAAQIFSSIYLDMKSIAVGEEDNIDNVVTARTVQIRLETIFVDEIGISSSPCC
ncbi:hypothetical protein ACLOJK_040916 [Asimina triloba]